MAVDFISCIAAGLVEGDQMSVDGSFLIANASDHSRTTTGFITSGMGLLM
jgi:hypothetical protein